MNPIDFLAAFLNALVACQALPMHEIDLRHHAYQVQSWNCTTDRGPILVRAWRNQCDTGHTKYWSRQVYLELGDTSMYLNRFGEVQLGVGASVEDAYQGPCGS